MKYLHYAIVGFGVTGQSCLEFLIKNNIKKITVIDSNKNIDQKLLSKYNNINFVLGSIDIVPDIDYLILSPGINPLLPPIIAARNRGVTITNDINIFLEQIYLKKNNINNNIKIIAITGTNGKTTVVNMLAAMVYKLGINYALCGNVGNPVLNYLVNNRDKNINLYILELSSYQLELINNLDLNKLANIIDVSCILNITSDHLDRYQNFVEYCQAKLNIYKLAKHIVYYKEDLNIYNNINNYGKKNIKYFSNQQNLDIKLKLLGKHNKLNALASLAIGDCLDFNKNTMLAALEDFKGLDYRCQEIGVFKGITWINDSKGTNIGATITAIEAIADKNINKKLIIILGGINKNADLSLLSPYIKNYCKTAILIGTNKEELFILFNKLLNCYKALDLEDAVTIANNVAMPGDTVLLSPACASFDMFNDYEHRGLVFNQCVFKLYHANAY